jgi:hypothetical protein
MQSGLVVHIRGMELLPAPAGRIEVELSDEQTASTNTRGRLLSNSAPCFRPGAIARGEA